MKKNLKFILFIILYLVILFFPNFEGLKRTPTSLWIQVTLYIILGITSIFIFNDLYKKSINEWKTKSEKNIKWLIAIFIINIILTALATIPISIISPEYESLNSNNIFEAIKIIPAPLILISLGILGPMVEEIIFRGILVGKLKKYIPTAICVIISSVLFMLIHIHIFTIEEFLYYLPFIFTGIVYSILFVKNENITLPMILHVLNNFFALLMAILSK